MWPPSEAVDKDRDSPVTVIPSEAEGSFPVADSQRKRSFDSLRSLKMTIRFEFVYNLRAGNRFRLPALA